MKPKPQTTEQQLQKELENLKVGHHQESAVYFIKPVNLLATGLSEPEDIADWIRLELDNNDLYNGYAIVGRREAIEYLSQFTGTMYNIDAALMYALDFGFEFQTIARMGSELLANIAANEQARQEDTDAIEGAAHRLALIIKAGTRVTLEDL
jgi:hypothetical protein